MRRFATAFTLSFSLSFGFGQNSAPPPAGVDFEMPSRKFMYRATLLLAVKSVKVSQATIDDRVRRILRAVIQFGWLDRDQTHVSIPLFNAAGREVALEAACSSIVPLKNDGNLVPLDKNEIQSIAVIGPDACPSRVVGGGSSVHPVVAVSYLEGLTNYLGTNAWVYYDRGIPSAAELADTTTFTTDADDREPGLRAEFCNHPDRKGTPGVTHTDLQVYADRGLADRTARNEVLARWTGYYTPAVPGDHLIFIQGSGENDRFRRTSSYYDPRNHHWTADPGEFYLSVNSSEARIGVSGKSFGKVSSMSRPR